ncbi:hypothetical protein [Microbispora sp. NBC_01389]|uniref:hypothetical protein n=1 Tax=Microbispora sp. NBC_01389 TaxID=2903584 RepID=UPI00325250E1
MATFAVAPIASAYAINVTNSAHSAQSYTYGSNVVRLINKCWATNPCHVYNQYYRSASPGTMRSYGVTGGDGKYIDSDTGSTVTKLRACETIPAWPDDCSDWGS